MTAWSRTNKTNVALYVTLLIALVVGSSCSSRLLLNQAVQVVSQSEYDVGERYADTTETKVIAITGGFFPKDNGEELIIKHTTNDGFRGGRERFEFYRKDALIGKMSNHHLTLKGLCRSPDTSLSLLFSGWGGGNATPVDLFYVKFDEPTNTVISKKIISTHDRLPEEIWSAVVACGRGQKTWKSSKKFTPCECTYSKYESYDRFANTFLSFIHNGNDLKISSFPSSFFNNEKYRLRPIPINEWIGYDNALRYETDFLEFLKYASNLPPDSGFTVKRTESSRFVVLTIEYESDVWRNYQYIIVGEKKRIYNQIEQKWEFVDDLGIGKWTAIYSSSSINFAHVKDFVSDSVIEVDMCVESCDGFSKSGKDGVVQIDLENNLAEFIGNVNGSGQYLPGANEESSGLNVFPNLSGVGVIPSALIHLAEFLGKSSTNEESPTTKDPRRN